MNIISNSVEETLKIGKNLAKNLWPGDVIGLCGELGSGKTVLTKGIASGLGIAASNIISPTFVLIRQHQGGRLPLYHFDLYRLGNTKEIMALGYEEYLYGCGVSVIEWADKLGYLLPQEILKINLSITDKQKRALEFKANGKHYQELITKLKDKTKQ